MGLVIEATASCVGARVTRWNWGMMCIARPFSELGSPGAQGELAAECHRAVCVASRVHGKLEEALVFSLFGPTSCQSFPQDRPASATSQIKPDSRLLSPMHVTFALLSPHHRRQLHLLQFPLVNLFHSLISGTQWPE